MRPGWPRIVAAAAAIATFTLWVDRAAPQPGEPTPEISSRTEAELYEYNATGKRDPFRPLSLKAKPTSDASLPLSPLQKYDLGQLKLVGVVYNLTPPRAMVEDSAGLGFILTPGTPVGPNGGVVTAIKPRQVVVEEWYTDVIGEKHRREITLDLPVEQTEAKR